MNRLRDRADLIEFVARKINIPACRRACLTGKVEVLGGFENIPPSLLSGWMLTITAKHGTVFHLAVLPDEHEHDYQIQVVNKILWQNWLGTPRAGAAYSLYQGDHPAAYDVRRDLAREKLERRKGVLL
jgi:hypothetical protein